MTEYLVVWVSPATGKEMMVDGGFFDSRKEADAWVKGLSRQRERDGVSKGTLHEVVNGRVGDPLMHIGGRS